jgi:hypothetical protein
MTKATGLVLSVSIVASLAGLAVIFVLAFSPPSETSQQNAKLDPPKPEPRPQPSRPHRPTPNAEKQEDDVRPTPKPPEFHARQPEPPYVPPSKPAPPVRKPEPKPDPPPEPEPTPGGDSTPDKVNLSPDAARQLTSQIAQLSSKNNGKSTRIEAAKTLGKLGPAASSASAALCSAIIDRNREVGDAALHALEKVNPVIYQALHPVIVDENPGTRQEGLRQLTLLGKEANAAAPVVIWHMRRLPIFTSGRLRLPGQPIQVHPEEPGDAVRALAAVAADDESVTKQIVSWVRAEVAPSARAAACAALPSMRGATSAKGIESLTLALQLDRDPTVRAAAAGALGEFGSRVPAKTAGLVTKAKDYDSSAIVREAASRALEKIRAGKDS